MVKRSLGVVVLVGGLVGCGANAGGGDTDAGTTPTDTGADASSGGDSGGSSNLCMATAPRCTDQQVAGLRLFGTVNPAAITEEGTTPGDFRTLVDARAGGSMSTQSYVYARFTPEGLQKVEISDEAAFGSLDWDIAIRRYVIRVNSGVAGPSCVTAARTAAGTMFDAVTSVPEGLTQRTEAYYTESCELVNDGSGIGAPGTALASFWSYRSCVQMSGNVFVVTLRDGRHVKLQVLSYYDPAPQEVCNMTGSVPNPNNAGLVRVRWSFLP